MKNTHTKLTRRKIFSLATGAVISYGILPDWLKPKAPHSDNFNFALLNDLHCTGPACAEWIKNIVAKISKLEQLEFVMIAGDVSDHGKEDELKLVKDLFSSLNKPLYLAIGNHDYNFSNQSETFQKIFPGMLNYSFNCKGWQFVVLDSTEGLKAFDVVINQKNLDWLEKEREKLDPVKPLILVTHFPLSSNVGNFCPVNASEVLKRLEGLNLKAVFSGHFHGYTENTQGQTLLYTDKCCARTKPNHDGTIEKGFFVCRVVGGVAKAEFVRV